ncbi:serine hydrolase [Microbacterium sp.]|uniref:serine hydrolase domain-containing protein n=1 Tax=Microbacterium sp. TaxID=51671 RepID=UPI002E35447F|nr:serine hydrolase [Microbacterium sp.]HEX5729202.1 serine hydrolase [Microbacterium sp.]
MNVIVRRWLLATILLLVVTVGCSPAAPPPSPPSPSPPAPTGTSAIDFPALEAEIERAITAGPASLDQVRAVLVNVEGETRIAHYRHGFTDGDYGHVFSVTKSVLSILVGIAIADGLILDIDQPLAELLPKHRQAMSGETGKVTLRHLMTMSGGFREIPGGFVWDESAKSGSSFIEVLLKQRQEFKPGEIYWYSDASAHLVAAVLATALENADGNRSRSVLDYAREKLFDPLEISTHPSFSKPLPDPLLTSEFVAADFGWGTDPNGIHLGGFGLRLTAPDMMKIGELYRRGGVWNGKQVVLAAWIQQCTAPANYESQIGGPLEYGLLWWILPDPEQAESKKPEPVGYAAIGFGGQRIYVLPEYEAVIVYLSDVQADRQIDDPDLDPLDRVFIAAFP